MEHLIYCLWNEFGQVLAVHCLEPLCLRALHRTSGL